MEKTEAIVYGGSAWDEFAAMQISSAGDIYICGNTKGYLAASHAGGLVWQGAWIPKGCSSIIKFNWDILIMR